MTINGNGNGKMVPYKFQDQGVDMLEKFNGNALLADEMGLGKTAQVLWFLERNRDKLPALVVCPASVKYHWAHHARNLVGMYSKICVGQTPLTRPVKRMPDIIVINYDILIHWEQYLASMGFTTFVLDECQKIANRTTLRTKAAIRLSRIIPNAIGASGTPLENKPAELWPALHCINPKRYPTFAVFAREYCKPKLNRWGWSYNGATNIKRLEGELRRHTMIRRRKVDVLKDLPDKVRHVIPMKMTDRTHYDHATTDFMSWLKQNQGHRVLKAKRAQAIVRINTLLQLVARFKARSVVEWINEFLVSTDEKILVAAIHKKMISVLRRRIESTSVVIDGSVRGKHRQAAIDQFTNDPGTRVFIGNIQACGTGTDGLQGACQNLAVCELPWKPALLTQLEDRLHRIGQKEKVWCRYLVAPKTIEERLCKINQEKQEILSAVLDGGGKIGDIDIFDQLMKEISV